MVLRKNSMVFGNERNVNNCKKKYVFINKSCFNQKEMFLAFLNDTGMVIEMPSLVSVQHLFILL